MHLNKSIDKNEAQSILEELFKYLEGQDKLINYASPDELLESFSFELNDQADTDLLNYTKQYLKWSVKTSSPQFFNQLWAGFSYPSFVAELINSFANTSMFTYEVAPLATLIESHLIKKMMEYAGFKDGQGIFTTGGTAGNISALLAARNTFKKENLQNGLRDHYQIYVSEICHYSFVKAANVAGIGIDNVIKIKTDDNFEMDIEDLEKQIQKTLELGAIPLMVAATSGTTVLGSFDPIDKISEITKKYKIWLHVDGAYGGSVLISNKHKHLMKGIEKADSLTWDPHKLMGIPLVCSTLLINGKSSLSSAHYHGESDKYLFHLKEYSDLNSGTYSIQCGRRPDSLKLFFTWKYYGNIKMGLRLDKLFSLSQYARNKVLEDKSLELVSEVYSTNINFRFIPKSTSDIDAFNILIRETLIKRGLSMVNYARVKDKTIIRLVITSPDIEESDLDKFFHHFQTVAKELDTEHS